MLRGGGVKRGVRVIMSQLGRAIAYWWHGAMKIRARSHVLVLKLT